MEIYIVPTTHGKTYKAMFLLNVYNYAHLYIKFCNQSKPEAICRRKALRKNMKDDLFIYIYMPPISQKHDSGWHIIKLQKIVITETLYNISAIIMKNKRATESKRALDITCHVATH